MICLFANLFLLAALNNLEILAADIGNAYLQAPVREKVHTTAGPEFGPNNVGRTVIVVRAMYGLKSSGAAWHAKFSETLHSMGFQSSLADPDVWMRPAKKADGSEFVWIQWNERPRAAGEWRQQ